MIIEMPGTDDSRSGKSIGVCEAILAVAVELLYIVSIVETGQGLSLYTLEDLCVVLRKKIYATMVVKNTTRFLRTVRAV